MDSNFLFSFSAGLVSFPVTMFHNIATFKTTDMNNQGNYRVTSVNQHHHNGDLSHQSLNDNHLSSIGHADSSGVTMEVMAVDQSWLGLKRRDVTLSVIWIQSSPPLPSPAKFGYSQPIKFIHLTHFLFLFFFLPLILILLSWGTLVGGVKCVCAYRFFPALLTISRKLNYLKKRKEKKII